MRAGAVRTADATASKRLWVGFGNHSVSLLSVSAAAHVAAAAAAELHKKAQVTHCDMRNVMTLF